MVRVTLVYPFFQPKKDNSLFRFPPLGLGYIAASLRQHGISVELVDCTFLNREEAIEKVKRSKPDIIGFYSMFSMKKTSLELAKLLRDDCDLLVVGGPLPTLDPTDYLGAFDLRCLVRAKARWLSLWSVGRVGAIFHAWRELLTRATVVL